MAVREITDGGVDYSFEAIGLKTDGRAVLRIARAGGTATIIGMIPVGRRSSWTAGCSSASKLQGSMMGSNRFRIDMPRYIDFYVQGTLQLDEMITRRGRLDDVNDAFRAMKAGEVARTVLTFD